MAKEKKRGFFSWLGFGQKEQPPEKETEVQNEQPVVEEIVQAQESAKASEQVVEEQPQAHTEAEVETFAADVVEVTEQVAESEKAQPEAVTEPEVITEPESVVESEVTPEPVAIEREALPLPEDVNAEEVSPEEWQAEAETVEIVEAAKEEITDEELEAQALAAEEEPPVEEIAQEQEKPTKEGFFARLKRSLLKTKENLGSGFISLFRGKKIDDDLFEELEEQLLIADVGVETTRKIINNLTEGATRKQLRDAEALYGLLKEEMGEILAKVDEPLNVEGKTPFVILMVGVNGVGKTTTIGKLARQFEQQGKSVMLAAGDTFRAAAVEQLQVWGQRNNIPVIAQHTGADSASVIFDAIQAAKARNIDVLIADTAGRLQNKSHLMEELKKIVRVMKKLDVEAPHEVMLTIDASTGQNAVSQAKLFHEAVGLTGITLTKLDGTAKGGVIFSVADQFGIPIRYIGVGERIEDLRPFKADDFIEALFARED
ncbi:signal recognition particle-docking protein FtsY [Escherichia coli]|uniref:signal recognition particle-docking protein FtsY n=1 Tax=Escherichia sp. MOD1-EC7003 TaxID=2093900 RepID=UPI000CF79E73|nr:signal recognition particle-docking protein FtsY [Escherichia sp. MOD1-EC7003]EGO8358976.1 signal recognition particle-docking protein FtsY [Escherichia coli]EGO8376200.1 signal recognition particle-docking protein FtsY [Escherichia coli]MCH0694037.1 signal recognition particle-docking protein FtsY [Escherichia coli]